MAHRATPRPAQCYAAAVGLSLLALVFLIVAFVVPRVGYPLAFVFTMFGVLAYAWPLWDLPEKRSRLLVASIGTFVTQAALLYISMASITA